MNVFTTNLNHVFFVFSSAIFKVILLKFFKSLCTSQWKAPHPQTQGRAKFSVAFMGGLIKNYGTVSGDLA